MSPPQTVDSFGKKYAVDWVECREEVGLTLLLMGRWGSFTAWRKDSSLERNIVSYRECKTSLEGVFDWESLRENARIFRKCFRSESLNIYFGRGESEHMPGSTIFNYRGEPWANLFLLCCLYFGFRGKWIIAYCRPREFSRQTERTLNINKSSQENHWARKIHNINLRYGSSIISIQLTVYSWN